jgi:hypothetical protein
MYLRTSEDRMETGEGEWDKYPGQFVQKSESDNDVPMFLNSNQDLRKLLFFLARIISFPF